MESDRAGVQSRNKEALCGVTINGHPIVRGTPARVGKHTFLQTGNLMDISSGKVIGNGKMEVRK